MAGNQYQADPRQQLFLAAYLDPKSETFSNAYRSALKAGYEDEYAKVILSKDLDWLSEAVKDENLVMMAEKALTEALGYVTADESGKVDAGAGRLKLDAAKLVLKGLKKDKYSERVEQTGKDGAPISITFDTSFNEPAS
jgi:hypothetical protein